MCPGVCPSLSRSVPLSHPSLLPADMKETAAKRRDRAAKAEKQKEPQDVEMKEEEAGGAGGKEGGKEASRPLQDGLTLDGTSRWRGGERAVRPAGNQPFSSGHRNTETPLAVST